MGQALHRISFLLIPVLVLCFSACSVKKPSTEAAATAAAQAPADMVFTNGKVYTMDAKRSWADSVAVRGGRLVYVGTREGIGDFIGANTRQVDLDGKMLLPSFQDVHLHPVAGGFGYTGCPLFGLETIEDVLDAVAGCAKASPDAPFIQGEGWNWGIFIGRDGPHKDLLDRIDNTRPIIIGDADGHTSWLNSSALALAGITPETLDPEGGKIGRDPDTGELTGTLMEGPAMNLIVQALPPITLDQQLDSLRYAQKYLHSLGITSMHDGIVELSGSGVMHSLDAYQAFRDSGELKLRVVAALYWEPGTGLGQIAALKAARQKYSGGRLQASAVKFWADGIIETRTAKLLEPYTDQPDTDGILMVPLEELESGIPALDAEGFQLHIHTIGDGTVRVTLDALEAARKANGVRDSRHLTAHTQLVDEADIGRFAALDVIAGFSPYWAYNEEYVAVINPPQIGPERMAQMYPINRIARTGARIAFGSDWSVASADPLLGMETAITRINPHEGDPTPVFNPGDRITLDEAIAGYTINAAFANFLDADTGSIEVGKYADLVILKDNLFDLEPSGISEASVVATIMEGELVFGDL
jgi:hypothetical protein